MSIIENSRDDKNILIKYQDVFVQSIMTSFGLDALFFASTDQIGGTVDTVNNVRQGVYSKQYGNEEKYKNHIELMGDRFNRDSYNKNKDFHEIGKIYKNSAKEGTLIDGYTGKILTVHDHFDREHIIPAHEIEKDAGRILAGIEGDKLASAESNLAPVAKSINRSKKDKSAEEYAAWLEKRRPQHASELAALKAKSQQGTLSDKERKQKDRLESISSVDQTLMLEKDRVARSNYNRAIHFKYYLGKEFLSQTGKETFKSGWKMGCRQAVGLILMEVWKALRTEWPHIMETWRSKEGWEKLDLRPVLQHIKVVILNAVNAVRERWKDIFNEMKNGFVSGLLSSLTTTIVNIFVKTGLSFMRLLRNFWSSIIGALQIMRSEQYATQEEKILAVMRLLSVAVAGILQPIITECIRSTLMPYLAGPLEGIGSFIAEFLGTFCSGIISVTLVHFIDTSLIVQRILSMAGNVIVNAVEIIGKGIGVTVGMVKNILDKCSGLLLSPAAKCLEMTLQPLMSVVSEQSIMLRAVDAKLDQQSLIIKKIEGQVDSLPDLVETGFADLRNVMETQTRILGHLLAEQGAQVTDMLGLIQKEMREGFDSIRSELAQGKKEQECLDFQTKMNQLLQSYQTCVEAVVGGGGSPSADDLTRVIDCAISFISWLATRLQSVVGTVGDVRRLPYLSAYVLAVQLEVDVRRFRQDDIALCNGRRLDISRLLRAEVEKLSEGKLFDIVASERSFLIEQYVLLHRAVKHSVNVPVASQVEKDGNGMPVLGSPELFVWADGLDPVRQVIQTLRDVPSGNEPEILVRLRDEADRKHYGELFPVSGQHVTVSAFKEALGIPGDYSLTAGTAFSLFCSAPKALAEQKRALQMEFAA